MKLDTPLPKDGITLTYADVNNRAMHDAMARLDQYTGYKDVQDIYRFNKLKGTFDREARKAQRSFQKLLDRHAHKEPVMEKDEKTNTEKPKLDDKGKPVTRAKQKRMPDGSMDIDFKDRKAFIKDYRDLMLTTFTIKVHKLKTEDLHAAGLTPREIRACARILSDSDQEDVEDIPVPDMIENAEDDDSDVETDAEQGTPDDEPQPSA